MLILEQLLALATAIEPRYRAVARLGGWAVGASGNWALQRSVVDLPAGTVTVPASAGFIARDGCVLGEPNGVSSQRVVRIPESDSTTCGKPAGN